MSSDFSAFGKHARYSIPTPEVPMQSIRRRARTAAERGRFGIIGACAAVAIALVVAGTGAGAKLYDGVRVWLNGGNIVMAIHSGVIMREPDAAALQREIAHATFPVLFPVGLPAGTRVQMITLTPMGRPSVVSVSYEGPHFKYTLTLVDPAVVDSGASVVSDGTMPVMKDAQHWRIGSEVVVVHRGSIAARELDDIKAAMAASSPSASLAATEALLPKVVVVGGDIRLGVAEQLRPAGRSVLIGKQGIESIPNLVTRAQPLLDRRVWHLSSITYRNGDIRTASMTKADGIAVSAAGVRAIGTVLQSQAKGASRCACEVLFNQPNANTYWIWTIPLQASGVARKYTVDARTFTVAP